MSAEPRTHRKTRHGRNRRLAAILAALGIAAGGAAAGLAVTSGPSYPHSWCGPVLTQLKAPHETRGQALANLGSLQRSGAPVGKLITDEYAYVNLLAESDSSGAQGYSATFALPGAIATVGSDLRQLNRECGQPADAWKSDNA